MTPPARPSPGTLGVLAVLSDGLPRTAPEIFRAVYESRISTAGLKVDLGAATGRDRLGSLLHGGLVEPVHDRKSSYFLTRRGRELLEMHVRGAEESFGPLVTRLVAAIEKEIGDGRQARMFAESRLANIWDLAREVEREPSKASRALLLRLAIVHRLEHLLSQPAGEGHDFMKAVHDQVTDYSYSRLMALAHDGQGARDIDVSGLAFREVAPGLLHGQLRTKSRHGPIFLNVLRVTAPRTLAVEDVSGRRKEERFITAIAERTGAHAVVSAGYFIYSEKGYEPPTRQFDPVGLCVVGGTLTQPPVFRRGSVLVDREGGVTFRRVGLTDAVLALPGGDVPIAAVNVAPEGPAEPALVAYNNVWGPEVAAAGGTLVAVVNGAVVATSRTSARVPLNGFVLRFPAALAEAAAALPGTAPVRLAGAVRGALHAVAAGPMLLEEGRFAMNYAAEDFQEGTPPVTFSGDRTIDRNLIPRCGIGTTPEGALVIAIVDGRQPHLSVGATLVEFASLMRALGATEALNLDGGGTAAMQVGSEVVSNPSTSVRIDARGRAEPARTNAEKNVRPLATALLVG